MFTRSFGIICIIGRRKGSKEIAHIEEKMTTRLHDRWPKRIIRDSKQADIRAGRAYNPDEFLDEAWLENQQTRQQNKCYHCGKFMNWIIRNGVDGLTCERLDNSKPHHKDVCVLACKSCNSKKLSREQSLLRRYFFRWYRNTFDVRQSVTNRRCSLA